MENHDQLEIAGNGLRQISLLPEKRDTRGKLFILSGKSLAQIITARARVRINVAQGFIPLFTQVIEYQNLGKVFQHVRVIAGVKGVAIT